MTTLRAQAKEREQELVEREQQTLAHVLQQLDNANERLDNQQMTNSMTDVRGPNGEYSSDFQMLGAELTSSIGERPAQRALKIMTGVEPARNTLAKWERAAAMVAEAKVAKCTADSKSLTMQFDQTTKFGVSIHGAGVVVPGKGRLTLGVRATPTKSAADQLAANRTMREDIARSGEALLGIKPANMVQSIASVMTDGGKTEAAMTRELNAEKVSKAPKAKKKRSGKDEKEEKLDESEIKQLLCHKHKLSNVSVETEAKGIKLTGVGEETALDLEYNIAKGFREQSAWGHSKGTAFTTFCNSKEVPNWLSRLQPSTNTRHHLRLDSMDRICLSLPTLRAYLETAAPTAKRGQAVAAGDASTNSLNKAVLVAIKKERLQVQVAVLAKLNRLAIKPIELAATGSDSKYLGVHSFFEMGPKAWQPLRQGLEAMVNDPMPYMNGSTSIFEEFPLVQEDSKLESNQRMQLLLERTADSLPEQCRQCKIIAQAMLNAVKKYCSDFIIPGQFADPDKSLIQQFKHVKPSNDAQERDFGILDYLVQTSRRQTTERTDVKLKVGINKPFELLAEMNPADRQDVWQKAKKEGKNRLTVLRERRLDYQQQKIANMNTELKKTERKVNKAEKKKKEYECVELARTVDDLKSLLRGVKEDRLGKQIVQAQIDQWTSVHGVSRQVLPKTRNGKTLDFTALYNNLSALLEEGDPFAPETAQRLRQKAAKRPGRPSSASVKERAQKKRKISVD